MKMMAMMVAVATLFAVSVQAADDTAGQLVRFKDGEVSFTLLQADGVTPMDAAPIQMLATDDSRVLAESVSDKLGKAIVTLTEGRYLLNVSGRTLSVLEVASDATLTSCRVVVPDAALMVAGQDEAEEENRRKGGAFWLSPVVIGGVVVLAAVGGYAIYDHNKDDDDEGGVVPPPPPPTPTPDKPPKKNPPPPSVL